MKDKICMYCEQPITEQTFKRMQRSSNKAHYDCYDYLKNIAEQIPCSGSTIPMLTVARVLRIAGHSFRHR